MYHTSCQMRFSRKCYSNITNNRHFVIHRLLLTVRNKTGDVGMLVYKQPPSRESRTHIETIDSVSPSTSMLWDNRFLLQFKRCSNTKSESSYSVRYITKGDFKLWNMHVRKKRFSVSAPKSHFPIHTRYA